MSHVCSSEDKRHLRFVVLQARLATPSPHRQVPQIPSLECRAFACELYTLELYLTPWAQKSLHENLSSALIVDLAIVSWWARGIPGAFVPWYFDRADETDGYWYVSVNPWKEKGRFYMMVKRKVWYVIWRFSSNVPEVTISLTFAAIWSYTSCLAGQQLENKQGVWTLTNKWSGILAASRWSSIILSPWRSLIASLYSLYSGCVAGQVTSICSRTFNMKVGFLSRTEVENATRSCNTRFLIRGSYHLQFPIFTSPNH